MLFSVLKNIKFNGTLEFIDSNNKKHLFGSGNPIIRVKLKNKSIEQKLFRIKTNRCFLKKLKLIIK